MKKRVDIIGIVATVFATSLLIAGCTGGSSKNGASNIGTNSGGTVAIATTDGNSVVFKKSSGAIVLTIPLQNQKTQTQGPTGTNITEIHEKAIITDDGTHAGINSLTVTTGPNDSEPFPNGTFRYYDSTGQLWQVGAPEDTAYYFPLNKNERLLTPNGSRVLLVSAGMGNSNPQLTVYDQGGNVLYQSSPGALVEFYQAQVSPNGKYLLVMGEIQTNGTFEDLVRVTTIDTQASVDFSIDLVNAGRPEISISNDGRFHITNQTGTTILPSS